MLKHDLDFAPLPAELYAFYPDCEGAVQSAYVYDEEEGWMVVALIDDNGLQMHFRILPDSGPGWLLNTLDRASARVVGLEALLEIAREVQLTEEPPTVHLLNDVLTSNFSMVRL